MRLTSPFSVRPGRAVALLCLLGLLLTVAWPAFAAPSAQTGEDGEQQGAAQGRRGTPVPTAAEAAGTPLAGSPVAGATPVAPGATPVAAAEPPALEGVFSVAIGEGDLPSGLAGSPALVGLWNLTLNADGTYTIARQDVGAVVSGRFSAVGETLTFEDWDGLIACANAEGESGATYAWRLTEDVLTLTPISDVCTDRTLLLSTRTLGSFESCATVPLALPEEPGQAPGMEAPGPSPSGPATGETPGATPTIPFPVEEGVPAGAEVEAAIDALLRQATGCWATGNPARFLPLHSEATLATFAAFPALINDVALFMATPVSFERIGGVNELAPDRAWAYVEITFGGEAIPQRLDFVREGDAWLFDYIFLLGPAPPPASPLP